MRVFQIPITAHRLLERKYEYRFLVEKKYYFQRAMNVDYKSDGTF